MQSAFTTPSCGLWRRCSGEGRRATGFRVTPPSRRNEHIAQDRSAALTRLLQFGRCLKMNSAGMLGLSCTGVVRLQNVVANSDVVLRFYIATEKRWAQASRDRKSTRLNSSHLGI